MSPSQAHCIAMKPSSAAGDGFLCFTRLVFSLHTNRFITAHLNLSRFVFIFIWRFCCFCVGCEGLLRWTARAFSLKKSAFFSVFFCSCRFFALLCTIFIQNRNDKH